MALPKLNETIKYTTKIPSTGKEVRFRPYLVKEERVLMIAQEQNDENLTLNAIADTIEACIEGDINVRNLPLFDLEYLFTQIRSKSVGENSAISIKCSECGHENKVDIDVSKINIKVPKGKTAQTIKLSPEVTLEMKYPSMGDIVKRDTSKMSETEKTFEVIKYCIGAVHTNEERIPLSDESDESIQDFLDSFSADQFKKIVEYVQNVPQMTHDVKFKCSECGHDNSIQLKGTSDFF
jgi:hypothetical protein